jgi:large subunit ribosomal protein L9
VPVQLHPELEVTIMVNVARSADEAERLARGEDVKVRRQPGDDEDGQEAALAAAQAMFEPNDDEDADETDEGDETAPEANAEAKPKAKRKAKAEDAE